MQRPGSRSYNQNICSSGRGCGREVRRRYRATNAEFDVVIGGHTGATHRAADRAIVESYVEAGATWWLEDVSPWAFGWNWQGPWPFATLRERIRRGPPTA
jgi:hypothetical protein